MEASEPRRNENVHRFFQELYETSKRPVDAKDSEAAKVTKIAKDRFPSFNPFKSFDPGKNIYEALQKLKSDIPHMSRDRVEQELSGAQYGLISLLNQVGSEKTDLKNWFNFANKCKSYASTVFYIKDLANKNPNLSATLNDPRFLEVYEQLVELFGRDQLDAETILTLALFWNNHSEPRSLLEEILKTGAEVRDINRQLVSQGQLPMIEDPHQKSFYGVLIPDMFEYFARSLTKEEYKIFQPFLKAIENQVLIQNTQIHSDGLYLAFNSSDKDGRSERQNERAQHQEKIHNITLKELQDKEEKESDPIKKKALQHELEILNSLKGYYPRSSGFGYETSRWEPVITADQPVRALVRIIGLANAKGQKNETITSLDLTQALGEKNLALSIAEKKMLSQLLIACDSVISYDPKVLDTDTWKTHLPLKIATVLKNFSNPEHPHLSTLGEDEKLELVELALKFALEVNLNFARVFFDLG